MDHERLLNDEQDAAIGAYVLQVTIPLLADGKAASRILGTGTLFAHEQRHFSVTAAHIFKEDEDDPSSADIDLKEVAYPAASKENGRNVDQRSGAPARTRRHRPSMASTSWSACDTMPLAAVSVLKRQRSMGRPGFWVDGVERGGGAWRRTQF